MMHFHNMFDACTWAQHQGRREPEAERHIEWCLAQNYDPDNSAHCVVFYARNVIKGRWPEHEDLVLKNAEAAFVYARTCIKDRWPEAEDVIRKATKEPWYWTHYKRLFKRGPAKDLWEKKWAWLKAEGPTDNLLEILNTLGMNKEMQEYIIQIRPDLIGRIRNLKPSIRRKYQHEDELAGVDL